MSKNACVVGSGRYLPPKVVTNADLTKIVDTSDEWIVQRSGIRERRIAEDDMPTSVMAAYAAEAALQDAGLKPEDIDAVIVATTTPDKTFPSVAALVQARLGIKAGFAFDLQAACTGFIYGLAVGSNFIKAGQVRRVLVIGAEKMSSILDWSDRTTCVLFGDGAGAVVLEAKDSSHNEGILSTHLYSDGLLSELLYVNGGVSTSGQSGHIIMQGREVFKHAVSRMAAAVEEALRYNGLSSDQIDWLVPHQANIRIIESTAQKLGMPLEKVILTVDHHGNTSAASIPMAFDEGIKSGKIKKGQMVLFEAMGAGLTWGAALLKY